MKIIDTDIAIDHFHGYREALDFFTQALMMGETLAMSVISLTEILAGMRPGEQERTEKLFDFFITLAVDEKIARKAGDYMNSYRASHHIELADALIAATAFCAEAELVTRNTKHYPMSDIMVKAPYTRGK